MTNLLEVWDLIFLSKSFGAIVVNDPQMKRANTGSNALEFIAINGKFTQSFKSFENSYFILRKRAKRPKFYRLVGNVYSNSRFSLLLFM